MNLVPATHLSKKRTRKSPSPGKSVSYQTMVHPMRKDGASTRRKTTNPMLYARRDWLMLSVVPHVEGARHVAPANVPFARPVQTMDIHAWDIRTRPRVNERLLTYRPVKKKTMRVIALPKSLLRIRKPAAGLMVPLDFSRNLPPNRSD